MDQVTRWVIRDNKTGRDVGEPYVSRSRAIATADKLDIKYGAYRYSVHPSTGASYAKRFTLTTSR